MSKIEILRAVVNAIRAIQAGTAQHYPMHVPCTVEEAKGAIQNVSWVRHAQGIELSIHDGWELGVDEDGWGSRWEPVPQYCGIEIRPMEAAEGPLHIHSCGFGVQGQDPWFRQVGEDWKWAVTPF